MAGNLTRINNNQITDASGNNTQLGINASTKVQDFSVSSTKLANNFIYGNNFTIAGNLQVNGETTTIDTTTLTVEDPLILLASGQTGTPVLDIGFIGERGTENNIASVWDESQSAFVTVYTDSTAVANTINILSYADFKTNNANVTGNLIIGGNLSLTGNIASLTVTGNITGGNLFSNGIVTASGTITGGNIATAGFVTATGNITGENIFGNAEISATGTVTGGNVRSNGTLSATGDITTAANISAAGTITSTNTITGGNLSTAGTVTANIITATGTITGGNIATAGFVCATGNVSGNNVNVTTDLSAGGNVTGGNILTAGFVSATGNVTGNYFIGNGSQLTDLPAGSFLSNGTSNVNIATADGNITMGVAGTADVVTVSATLLSVNGNIFGSIFSASGNITSNGNIDGGNVLTNGLVSASANVTGGNITSGGVANITGTITGGNILTTGEISAAGTANVGNIITSGTITATGNTQVGNLLTGGLVSATGSITSAGNISGNNISASESITANNVSVLGNVSAAGNVSAGNVNTANVNATGILTFTAGTGVQFSSTGNINIGNVSIVNLAEPFNPQDAATKFYVDSVAQGLDVKASVIAATTGNIDLTGTQTIDGVAITANARVLVKNQDAPAENGIYVASAGAWARSADANTYNELIGAFVFVEQGTVNADTGYVCTINAGGTLGTTPITWTQFSGAGAFQAGNGLTLSGTTFSVNTDNVTTTITAGNVVVKNSANLTTPNIGDATFQSLSVTGGTGVIVATAISATANVTTVDVVASGFMSATGYVLGSNVFVTSLGNTTIPFANSQGGLLSNATFTFANGVLNVGNVSTTGTVTADGNITGGNISAGGNITSGNVISAVTLTATGNIYAAGNVLVGANVSVTGNVTANYYFGDGSQLTNLSAGSSLVNGNSNVTVAANSNVSFTVNSVANIVVVSSTGISTSGNVTGNNVSVTTDVSVGGNVTTAGFANVAGNVIGGNISTAGFANVAGNVIGGNISTAGFVSAQGNVTSGNVFTAGFVTATGTITGGNVETGGNITATGNIVSDGLVTATGNVQGGNLVTAGFITATGNATAGNMFTAGFVTATGNITTANAINGSTANIVNNALVGSLSVTGNVFGGNVFFVNTSTNTASFGNSTQTTNAIVAFNATNSILLPVGTTTQRPTTGVTGMVRWNTTEGALEAYDGVEWATVGAQQFTVIENEQFNGDGTTVEFTLNSAQTTDSCIVTINGVVQIPTTAYGVTGTTLRFTEAPAVGDTIDVRQITTTTTVTGLTAPNISLTGNIVATLGATPTTALVNSSLTFSLADNNSLIVSVKGSDGTVRSATITLA